ncbi:hypothetical protein GCM10008959_23330 [Deinococcus seoulensis]|uniref:Lipoprotein n=1 Tax=Deinococcus seoulensis TaxID=1837379 RepID=A0ABQ2RW89_9DEIO|nr:hypothetical protein [Deinococcus seoulensis]GGR60848.1 hypothetical protein GCM10008959_23330 [Deinococcus seoulensis]
MKRISALLPLVILTACAPTTYENPWTNFGVYTYDQEGNKTGDFTRKTGDLFLKFDPRPDQINFGVRNDGKENAFIIWDESTLVYGGGKTSPVMHIGIKYTDRSNAQKPSVIPPGAYLSEAVIPINLVEWIDGNRYVAGRWIQNNFVVPVEGSQSILYLVVQDGTGKRTEKFTSIVFKAK